MWCGSELFTPPEQRWIVSDQLMFGFANKTAFFFPENDALLRQTAETRAWWRPSFFCLMMFSIKTMTKVNDSLKRAKNNHSDPRPRHHASLWPLFDVSFKQRDTNPPQKQNKGTQHFPHKPGVERTLKTSKSEQMWLAQRWHHGVCLWKSHTCLMLGMCKSKEKDVRCWDCGFSLCGLRVRVSATPATFWSSEGWRTRERRRKSERVVSSNVDEGKRLEMEFREWEELKKK